MQRRQLVLIVCDLNLALWPPTHSFTKYVQSKKYYPLLTSSMFTVIEVRREVFFFFFVVIVAVYFSLIVPLGEQMTKLVF